MKTKKLQKKWKFDKEKPFELFVYLLKFLFLFTLSVILFYGYEIFKEIENPTTFQNWIFLIIIFCGLAFLFWKTFTWRTTYPFGFMAHIFLLVVVITNHPEFFEWALSIFCLAIIYDILRMLGLRTEIIMHWRGKRLYFN